MKKLILVIFTLFFIGCSEIPTLYHSNDYKGEPIQIADDVYFKKVYIQGMYVLLQCDATGKIIHGQTTNIGYKEGKAYKHLAVLTTNNSEFSEGMFTFKCSNIDDCYNQIVTAKNSMDK